MNPVAIDIKDMLEADSSLALTYATDLFISKEPPKPNNCVTLYDTPSFPPDRALVVDNIVYNSSIQIRIRNLDYTIGMALARNIMSSLHARAQETWNGALYTVIQATGEPALLHRDENDRVLIIINFNIKRR